MTITSRYCFLLSIILAGCGSSSAKDPVAPPSPKADATPAVSEFAIVRVPVGQGGEIDLARAELRTSSSPQAVGLDDASLAENFSKIGNSTSNKVLNSPDELDANSSTESWFFLPWRARVAAGVPVRSGPYLLPWRRAIAHGYPVRAGGYLLPFRSFVANSYNYYMYGYGPSCVDPCAPPPCCDDGFPDVGYPNQGPYGAGY